MNYKHPTPCGALNRRELHLMSININMQSRLQSYLAPPAEGTHVCYEVLAASKPVLWRHRVTRPLHHTASDEPSARAGIPAAEHFGFVPAAERFAPALKTKRMRHRLLNRLKSNRDRQIFLMNF